jgi:hypothetical protein
MVAPSTVEHRARSTLLRGGLIAARRPRRYLRRRLSVILTVAAFMALVAAISLRVFPLSGPTRALYWVHDALWLPVQAAVWTSWYPYGLVWLVPMGTFALLVGLEFLGLAQLVRRGQLGLFSAFLKLGLDPFLVATNRLAARRAGPEGTLLEALARERHAAALMQVLDADTAALSPLQRYQRLLLNLAPKTRTEALAALEAMALARSLNQPEDAALREALGRHWLDLAQAWAGWTAPPPSDPAHDPAADILQAAARLPALSSEEMALATLRHAQCMPPGHPALLAWFSAWADLRYAGAPSADALRSAEAMIQFEYWSAWAEGPAKGAALDGLLTSALPALAPLRDRGERAARSISWPGRTEGAA